MINPNLEVREANYNDIQAIMDLLLQVNNIHAEIRPDLFIPEGTKYNEEDLRDIIESADTNILVCVDNGNVLGHAIVKLIENTGNNIVESKELYIDDLCVNEGTRLMGCGKALYEGVVEFAHENNCNRITLNCYVGNEAKDFYERLGFKPYKVYYEMKIEG